VPQFVVDGFEAHATQTWSWSVSNKANNSGSMSVDGKATWSISLDRGLAPLQPDGGAILAPDTISGGVAFPVKSTVSCTRNTIEAQHKPVHESDGMAGVEGRTAVEFSGTPGTPDLTVVWFDFRSFANSLQPTPFGFEAEPDLWTTTSPVTDLLRNTTFPISGCGRQRAAPGKGVCLGCEGFTSSGEFEWTATLNLRPFNPQP
jgi:hypothetical protein